MLERKRIHAERITIGREVNNDRQDLKVSKQQEFENEKEIVEKILSLSYSPAERLGVDRNTFYDIRQRIKNTGDIKTPAVRRLTSHLSGS